MNFSRIELKLRAKEVLSIKYWPFFLVGLLQSIISGIFSVNIDVSGLNINTPTFAVFGAVLVIFSFFISVFLKSPLRVAICRFMLVNSENSGVSYNSLWDIFKDEYIKVVKATFMKNLLLGIYEVIWTIGMVGIFLAILAVNHSFGILSVFLFVISFVLFIGGMVLYVNRFYSYYMVDYLLSENPDMGWKDAINASKSMMSGVKFETFILEISFLGWVLLGVMACGIGVLFVAPYQNATITQLYIKLRDERFSGYKIV